jgi:hypothetical protein
MESIAITKIYNLTAILRSCVSIFIQLHDASIFKLRSPGFQRKNEIQSDVILTSFPHLLQTQLRKNSLTRNCQIAKAKTFSKFQINSFWFHIFFCRWMQNFAIGSSIIITVNRGGLESKYLYKGHWKSCDLFWVFYNIVQ